MMDDLIEGIEKDPHFGAFHLDGQTILLDDYLEIMPQNRERIQSLLQRGKLIAGPWYCMPDEFLLSGESLIKNLQTGHQKVKEYQAEPLKYGYLCDIFGHIAQMPQILSGMGINHALLGRGTNEHTTPPHFIWEGIDGTRLTAFKLADQNGYSNFSVTVLHRERDSRHLSDEVLTQRIKQLTDSEINRSNLPVIVLMDAADHAFYHPDTPRYLRILKELYPEAAVHHSAVPELCAVVERHKASLPVKKGELREPAKTKAAYLHLITHTLSSRYPLKKSNDRIQTLLEKWVQPIYAFGDLSLPPRYLSLANQYLLQNQAHDSICGCSVDQVHKDMEYRFDQAELICTQIIDEFSRSRQTQSGTKKLLRIYNPSPYRDTRVIEATIEFDPSYPAFYEEPFGYERINSFQILDCYGKEIPYGISDIQKSRLKRTGRMTRLVDFYTVVFEATLAPFAFTEFEILPLDMPSRYLERLEQSEAEAENAYLKLKINPNGTMDLFDKQTGRTYGGLLTALDDGEIGDGWYHVSPACDRIITNTAARIEKIESNINRVIFKVTQTLTLPVGIVRDASGIKRSDTYAPLLISHVISLSRNEKWVRVHTQVDNGIKDHRLRIKLPTGIKGDSYCANQPFCFVRRPAGVDPSTQNWRECEVPEKQTSGIVFKKDQDAGFAFLSHSGLHECAVSESGDLVVTLFRSFSKTTRTDGEKSGQLPGLLEFSYLLMPFGQNTSAADLQRRQDLFQSDILCVNCYSDEIKKAAPEFTLDSKHILFSTATPADGRVDLRIYNMSNQRDSAKLTFGKRITSACFVSLDGQTGETIPIRDNAMEIHLGKWQFKTIRIEREAHLGEI